MGGPYLFLYGGRKMTVNILAVGDVVGDNGVDFLFDKLRGIKKLKNISFTVVNGENASMIGITPKQASRIFDAGADVITLGNHAFGKFAIIPFLESNKYILRPANMSPLTPGEGSGIYETSFGRVCVIDLIGRCEMEFGPDNPFFELDRQLRNLPKDVKIVLVDMHAEATSEKAAIAHYSSGRVTAVWGTHTHVQTNDAGILENGCAFITDLGMTGAVNSILGIRPEQSVGRFLGKMKTPYSSAAGPCKIEGCIFEVDTDTGKAISAEAVRVI